MTDGITKDAILTNPPIDSLMNSGAVEGVEIPVEASPAPEGTPDWEQRAKDAEKALSALKLRTMAVATRWADQHGLCSKVDRALAEISPDMKRLKPRTQVTATLSVTYTIDGTTNAADVWKKISNAIYAKRDRHDSGDESVRISHGFDTFATTIDIVDITEGPTVADVLGDDVNDDD